MLCLPCCPRLYSTYKSEVDISSVTTEEVVHNVLSKALAHHPQTNSHNGSNASDTGYLYFTRAVDVELTVTTLVLYYMVIIILSL